MKYTDYTPSKIDKRFASGKFEFEGDLNRSRELESAYKEMQPILGPKENGTVIDSMPEGFESLTSLAASVLKNSGRVEGVRIKAIAMRTNLLAKSHFSGQEDIDKLEDGPEKEKLSKSLDAKTYLGLAKHATILAEMAQKQHGSIQPTPELIWRTLGNAATKAKLQSMAAIDPQAVAKEKNWNVEDVEINISRFDEPNATTLNRLYKEQEPKTIRDIRDTLGSQFGGLKSYYTSRDLDKLSKAASISLSLERLAFEDRGTRSDTRRHIDLAKARAGQTVNENVLQYDPAVKGGLKEAPSYKGEYFKDVVSALSIRSVRSGIEVKDILATYMLRPESVNSSDNADINSQNHSKSKTLVDPTGPFAEERMAARENLNSIPFSSRNELKNLLTENVSDYIAETSEDADISTLGKMKAYETKLREPKDQFSDEAFAIRDRLIDERLGKPPLNLILVQEVARMEKMREDREVETLIGSWKEASTDDKQLANMAIVTVSRAVSSIDTSELGTSQKVEIQAAKQTLSLADQPKSIARVSAKIGNYMMKSPTPMTDQDRVSVRAAIAVSEELDLDRSQKLSSLRA